VNKVTATDRKKLFLCNPRGSYEKCENKVEKGKTKLNK
jgi:hypothetical protein